MLFIMVELHPLNSIELKKNNDGYIPNFVNTPDILPSVSVVTITYCREHLFELAVNNWQNFEYNGTMEWIILDDSPREIRKITKKLLPKNDKRIKYYSCNKIDSIGKKRNKIVELAQNEIIVTMDDDDYYPQDSVYNRVMSIISSGKPSVACESLNCINLLDNSCFKTTGGSTEDTIIVAEASMAYYKSFWQKQTFCDSSRYSECEDFYKNRKEDCINLNSAFVMIAISHSQNMSDRTLKNSINLYNFFNELPVATVNLIEKLQLKVFDRLPGAKEANLFVKNHYNDKNKLNTLKQIGELPAIVRCKPVIGAFLEEIMTPEILRDKTMYVLYFPGLYIRNINEVSEDKIDINMNYVNHLLKNFKEYTIKVFCYTHGTFTINGVNYIPWYYFNKKRACDILLVVDEISHLETYASNKFNLKYFLDLTHFNTTNLSVDKIFTYSQTVMYNNENIVRLELE